MSVQFSITVANVATLVTQGFTTVEIWASTDQGNSFQEITTASIRAATLTSLPATTLFDMNGGTLLKLRINGAPEVSINFSGTPVRYWTPVQVMNRINTVVSGLASTEGTSVTITSPTTGRVSSLLVTYNDAFDLGLATGSSSLGSDTRISLNNTIKIYTYTDLAGVSTYLYKWRFSANGVNPVSEYSTTVLGKSVPFTIPVSIGTATFVGIDGRPQVRTVIIGVDNIPFMTNGMSIGNDLVQTFTSDVNGYVQIPLVQGSKIKVALEGTSYVREIMVPTTTSFDLMAAMATAEDPFTIQVPVPYLTRRGP